MVRLPQPSDLAAVVERATSTLEQVVGLVPRVLAMLDDTQRLLGRVDALIDRIEQTRAAADTVVERTAHVSGEAERLLAGTTVLLDRLTPMLDRTEPSLQKLLPSLERLADTTEPDEVDALVVLVDLLPRVTTHLETHVLPIMDSMGSVAPDLHDLLDVARETNEMLARIPGMGRIKDRVEQQQAIEGRG
jgi:ABC-type transporter Mla subunit MlaD